MNTRRRVGLVLIAALLGFSCAPVLSPSLAPTLNPSALNTAIALTAGAASGQTVSVPQEASQPLATPVLLQGPTLDAESLNTAIAQTAGAAATQTAAFIPPTLTPSVTPFATWTPSITPSPTSTFLITVSVPTIRVTIPVPGGGGSSGGGGGGGGGGGNDPVFPYSCRVLRVIPKNNAVLVPGQRFDAVWMVKNKGDNWPKNSVNIVYVEGTIPHQSDWAKLSPISPYDISGGTTVTLPAIQMQAPSQPGIYMTWWRLAIGNVPFCNLTLTIVVQKPHNP